MSGVGEDRFDRPAADGRLALDVGAHLFGALLDGRVGLGLLDPRFQREPHLFGDASAIQLRQHLQLRSS